MWTVRDAEHIVILISIAGGLFCARVWSVAAVTAIAALLFPTLLALFVSPDWKRNFVALAAYYMVICGVFAFGAHLLRRAIGIVVRSVRRSRRPSDQGKV